MTYTPDSLWALVHHGTLSNSDREQLSDCAHAWEADLRRLEEKKGEADTWEQAYYERDRAYAKLEADNAALASRPPEVTP